MLLLHRFRMREAVLPQLMAFTSTLVWMEPLELPFDPTVLVYTMSLAPSETSTFVTANRSYALCTATPQINVLSPTAAVDSVLSAAQALQVGDNVLSALVVSKGTFESTTYAIHICRLSSDTMLGLSLIHI